MGYSPWGCQESDTTELLSLLGQVFWGRGLAENLANENTEYSVIFEFQINNE